MKKNDEIITLASSSGPIFNKENMRHALEYISEQSRRAECAGIYAAHDPEVLPGIYAF